MVVTVLAWHPGELRGPRAPVSPGTWGGLAAPLGAGPRSPSGEESVGGGVSTDNHVVAGDASHRTASSYLGTFFPRLSKLRWPVGTCHRKLAPRPAQQGLPGAGRPQPSSGLPLSPRPTSALSTQGRPALGPTSPWREASEGLLECGITARGQLALTSCLKLKLMPPLVANEEGVGILSVPTREA